MSWLRLAPFVLLVAALPASQARAVFASAGSTLLEAVVFLCFGSLLARILPRAAAFAAFAGCGCGDAARSLPAAALTWMTFGPGAAIARFAAGTFLARRRSAHHPIDTEPLAALDALLVPAIAGSVAVAWLMLHAPNFRLPAPLWFLTGTILGPFLPPCGIAIVSVAAAMRPFHAPLAAGMLVLGGIFAWRPNGAAKHAADPFAYAACALACAFAAFQHGAQLLNPRFTLALWLCGAAYLVLAWQTRAMRSSRPRLCAGFLLLATLAGGGRAQPAYGSGEMVAGERFRFTGVVTRVQSEAALVRQAILCCRADAAPVVVRLAEPPRVRNGAWLSAEGVVHSRADGLVLRIERFRQIRAPADPYLYR